jgi:3-oxoadipate enol-lactonase
MTVVELPGLRMYVEQHGDHGTPIVLLHGLGSSADDWSPIVHRLAEHHRLILPEVRGHARTERPPGPYTVALFAADIAALCEHLGIRSAHFAGLSMGGMIAFQLALDRPDLVRSLIIVNSGPEVSRRTLRERLAIAMRVGLLRILGLRRMARRIAQRVLPKPEHAAYRAQLEQRLAENDPDVYLRTTHALLGWSVADRLGDIACPVLVFASVRDYSPVEAKRAYAAKLRRARVEVLEDSGHGATVEQPGELTAGILSFVAEVDAEVGAEGR